MVARETHTNATFLQPHYKRITTLIKLQLFLLPFRYCFATSVTATQQCKTGCFCLGKKRSECLSCKKKVCHWCLSKKVIFQQWSILPALCWRRVLKERRRRRNWKSCGVSASVTRARRGVLSDIDFSKWWFIRKVFFVGAIPAEKKSIPAGMGLEIFTDIVDATVRTWQERTRIRTQSTNRLPKAKKKAKPDQDGMDGMSVWR